LLGIADARAGRCGRDDLPQPPTRGRYYWNRST
jgi:hypothetical protein